MSQRLLSFLKELSNHNSKEWMDANRELYLAIKEDFLSDVADILAHLSKEEPLLGELKPKDCVFRQNRDVRFSANKQPYKINLAAYFAIGGKKSEGPGYYLHLQPEGSFLAGGIWMPPAVNLKKIRQEIDYSGKALENILTEREFSKYFGEMEGEQLKTVPRDYDKEHPYIHYLRFKSFIVSRTIKDEEVVSGEYVAHAKTAFEKMKPFHEFLAAALDQADDGAGIL